MSHGYRSLSDELRAEVRFRGLTPDRDVLRQIGHELRLRHGSGVLSERVLKALAFERRQGAAPAVTIIDSIRNPAEVRALRDSLGEDFVLIAVLAPEDEIVRRIRGRARAGDVVDNDELAKQVLAAEMGLNEPEHGHNIAACIELADRRIDNSGTIKDLRRCVSEVVDELAGQPS